jgi:hypothetical protein
MPDRLRALASANAVRLRARSTILTYEILPYAYR